MDTSGSLNLAKGYVKDAQKASKSSWFSSPEWDTAAQYWDKAAGAYKTARHFEEAIDCHVKASEAFTKVNAQYLAAKGYEYAASLAEKQLNDHAKTVKYYTHASDLYRLQGSSAERAAEMMEKAAKACEDIDTSQAIKMYEAALTIYETEDRGRFSSGTFKKLTAYLIEKNRLSEAADVQLRFYAICEQINNRFEINKCRLSTIVLLLAFGDNVEAGKKMDEFSQNMDFVRTEEFAVADKMLHAYGNGDQEEFTQLARSQTVSFLDSAISRLAAKIRVPGAVRKEPPAQASSAAVPRAIASSAHPSASTAPASFSAAQYNNNSSNSAAAGVPPEDEDDDLL
ncbi:hypothetical protein GGI25_003449 [Coemansia spiralis]|uniref:Gamma-soluble NSF attachment protein n=2 Tax=Coemansia TaxID=4863 RepID=A0A9W8G1X3_9FUNG|nr:soluble NSF attachment protein [Coemansia spiralis]KAJ1991465.1 hypothetical protein EDC05_003389 [Coemansia umbellata]KAJ2621581.1 hypothetical protein GGI26_004044 [Coemansia sp. RSA 1358]KAJ2676697.1 hypothetical protein GGI25_003449 [Coemansia spiralis]